MFLLKANSNLLTYLVKTYKEFFDFLLTQKETFHNIFKRFAEDLSMRFMLNFTCLVVFFFLKKS